MGRRVLQIVLELVAATVLVAISNGSAVAGALHSLTHEPSTCGGG
jgi:hypothetical protein